MSKFNLNLFGKKKNEAPSADDKTIEVLKTKTGWSVKYTRPDKTTAIYNEIDNAKIFENTEEAIKEWDEIIKSNQIKSEEKPLIDNPFEDIELTRNKITLKIKDNKLMTESGEEYIIPNDNDKQYFFVAYNENDVFTLSDENLYKQGSPIKNEKNDENITVQPAEMLAGGSKSAQNKLVKNHRKNTQNRRLKKRRYTNKRSNRRK
jgi:hypothetical protein